MVRHDGVDDVAVLLILLGEVGADLDMGALLLVVDRFADVVQQARALGEVDVQPQLRRHHAGELRDLDGVLVDVLAVAGCGI